MWYYNTYSKYIHLVQEEEQEVVACLLEFQGLERLASWRCWTHWFVDTLEEVSTWLLIDQPLHQRFYHATKVVVLNTLWLFCFLRLAYGSLVGSFKKFKIVVHASVAKIYFEKPNKPQQWYQSHLCVVLKNFILSMYCLRKWTIFLLLEKLWIFLLATYICLYIYFWIQPNHMHVWL